MSHAWQPTPTGHTCTRCGAHVYGAAPPAHDAVYVQTLHASFHSCADVIGAKRAAIARDVQQLLALHRANTIPIVAGLAESLVESLAPAQT